MKLSILTMCAVSAAMLAASPALAQWDDPKEASRKSAEQAWAKAQAEKARKAIVEKQRAAERARKNASPTPSPSPSAKPQSGSVSQQ